MIETSACCCRGVVNHHLSAPALANPGYERRQLTAHALNLQPDILPASFVVRLCESAARGDRDNCLRLQASKVCSLSLSAWQESCFRDFGGREVFSVNRYGMARVLHFLRFNEIVRFRLEIASVVLQPALQSVLRPF